MSKKPDGYTYTILDPNGVEANKANPDRVTYTGFTTCKASAVFLVLAIVEGESDLWSLECDVRPDGGARPSALGIAELKRFYRQARGAYPERLIFYRRVES